MKFVVLDNKIQERGIRKSVIAKTLGITERSLRNKIDGERPFTWEQACMIHSKFFPDLEKDVLFSYKSELKVS